MSSFADAIERGRKGLPGPMKKRPPLSQAYWDKMLAGCSTTPWIGEDEDAVRFRSEEARKDADDREAHDNWSHFHGGGGGPLDTD